MLLGSVFNINLYFGEIIMSKTFTIIIHGDDFSRALMDIEASLQKNSDERYFFGHLFETTWSVMISNNPTNNEE